MIKTKHVLVVEDDVNLRRMLVELLEDQGYQVVEAETGRKALALISGVKFELITLDLAMPEMDGNEFLSRLSRGAAVIPVIVVSANPGALIPHTQVKAVVAKPFDISEFLRLVELHIMKD